MKKGGQVVESVIEGVVDVGVGGLDGTQRGVDFVGDASDEVPQGGQFLRLNELILRGVEFFVGRL